MYCYKTFYLVCEMSREVNAVVISVKQEGPSMPAYQQCIGAGFSVKKRVEAGRAQWTVSAGCHLFPCYYFKSSEKYLIIENLKKRDYLCMALCINL